jgi:hypothetical protein
VCNMAVNAIHALLTYRQLLYFALMFMIVIMIMIYRSRIYVAAAGPFRHQTSTSPFKGCLSFLDPMVSNR